jgi:hypothetical protein
MDFEPVSENEYAYMGENIEMNLRGWEGVDWIYVAQDRTQMQFVNIIMNFQIL